MPSLFEASRKAFLWHTEQFLISSYYNENLFDFVGHSWTLARK